MITRAEEVLPSVVCLSVIPGLDNEEVLAHQGLSRDGERKRLGLLEIITMQTLAQMVRLLTCVHNVSGL